MEEYDIENEIRDLVNEEIAKIPPVEFPDVQKVEVINQPEPVINVTVPEIRIPNINVPEPKVTVEAPNVTVDNKGVADAISELKQAIQDNRPTNEDILDALDDVASRMEKSYKEVKIVGGGSGGIASNIYNASSVVINPATEEKQDDAISLLTNGTAVKAADSPSIDAFGRWRVSNPVTLFDSKQLYDNAPLFWDDQETSGTETSSSHSVAEAATTITVGTNTAGTRVRQTFMRFNYQPGKSQLIFVTCSEFETTTGITKRFGYFDENNGLFFESAEGTVNVVRRTKVSGSVVNNKVAQSSWNLDTMDGTGASGITLDFDSSLIGVIDFEWLGVGRVRMGFVIDGIVYYCHEFLNTNSVSSVYMSTPNLPVRYEISNDGNGTGDDFVHICSTVISEGGTQDNGVVRYTSTANTQVDCAVVGSLYAVKGLRLKSTHLSATVKIISAAISVQSAGDDIEWILVFNPTIAGSPSWANETNSAVQSFTGATANTITGGTQITGGYLSTGTGLNSAGSISFEIPNALLLGSLIDGTQQTVVLCAKPLTNVNTLVEGSLTWRELL